MRRWLGALVLVWGLAAPPVAADVCALVDRDTARRAAALIAESGIVVFEDWFAPSRPATRRNMALIRKRRARPGPRQIGSSGTGSRHVRHENGGRPTNVLRLKRVAGHLMRP